VGRALLPLERSAVDLAAGGDFGGDCLDRAVAERGGGFSSGLKQRNELGNGWCLAPPYSLGSNQIELLMQKNL
jgi:hypothetical protein